MRGLALALAACLACAVSSPAENATPKPFKDGERLRYEVIWPSGLSLGEAEFRANATPAGWEFRATLEASLPTFEVEDRYVSSADMQLCSQRFEKDVRHGPKETHEEVEFDQEANRARRRTLGGGGESVLEMPPCARDGLTYLYFLRQDLARGRIPPPDDVNFGAQYLIVITYAETRPIEIAGRQWDSDRMLVDITGPKARHSFEMFFARDEARTPLLVRVPFELGTFSLKLVE